VLRDYLGFIFWAQQDPHRVARWVDNTWDKLAFVARYGNVSPTEAASWEMTDLQRFANSIAKIVKEENKQPSMPRGRRRR
jgi:hypothetical protein